MKEVVYISKNMNNTTMTDVIGPYWAILGPIGHFLHFFYLLVDKCDERGYTSTNLDILTKKEVIV